MAQPRSIEEIAALGFVDDLPEDVPVQRRNIRNLRLEVRRLRSEFDTGVSDIRMNSLLSEAGIADGLSGLAERQLEALETLRTKARQAGQALDDLARPAGTPQDPVASEVRQLRHERLLDRFMGLPEATRFELLTDPSQLDPGTIEALLAAPAWIRARSGLTDADVLERVEDAALGAAHPGNARHVRAGRQDLATLENELAQLATTLRSAAGGDPIAAAARG